MSKLAVFEYENKEVGELCDDAARVIRDAAQNMVAGAITIGKELMMVKETLSHGEFGPWLEVNFNWSRATATSYMRMARVVTEYPMARDLDMGVLRLLTSQVPDDLKLQIVNECPSREEAEEMIRQNDVRAWGIATDDLVNMDPGMAYSVIQENLGHPVFGEAASEALDRHKEVFARLSDMTESEILADNEITLAERTKSAEHGNGRLELTESLDEDVLRVWVKSTKGTERALVVAKFPVTMNPVQQAYRQAAVDAVVKKLRPTSSSDYHVEGRGEGRHGVLSRMRHTV